MPEIIAYWKPVPYHYDLRLLDVRSFTPYSFGISPCAAGFGAHSTSGESLHRSRNIATANLRGP
ncbi:MAG: hypothetical protein QXS27_05010 [Candidatus Jordarchaeaceae archaeon]